jgi:guanylate kinase
MMNEPGQLIILSGPSGSGKDTVLDEMKKLDPSIIVSISMTTRKPRNGEVNGVNYFFVSHEEFEDNIKNNKMLEYARYGDNYYGTPKAPIDKWLAEGKNVVLKIEVKGAGKIRTIYPDAVSIFLMPPSFKILQDRLTGRCSETPEDIAKRIEIAKSEIIRANEYDYIIVNDRLPETVGFAMEVLAKHRR